MSQPLIVLDASPSGGNVVALLACNEKSRMKSLEQGELWYVAPDTGRVLPFRGGGVPVTDFVDGDGWWQVKLAGEAASNLPVADAAPAADGRPATDTTPPVATVAAARSGRPSAAYEAPGGNAAGDVLGRLGDLIAERHHDMPEGSYTTHLFSKGPSKIRKKLGEEAVETILAATADELRSEAADLIYHLMVLLEAEGQRLESVIAELDARHRAG